MFVYRLEEQLRQLKECRLTAKFGGATGTYNAHHEAYPEYDWKAFGNRFVSLLQTFIDESLALVHHLNDGWESSLPKNDEDDDEDQRHPEEKEICNI